MQLGSQGAAAPCTHALGGCQNYGLQKKVSESRTFVKKGVGVTDFRRKSVGVMSLRPVEDSRSRGLGFESRHRKLDICLEQLQ